MIPTKTSKDLKITVIRLFEKACRYL